MIFDGREHLRLALEHHNIRLEILVAETSIWANPKVHDILKRGSNTGPYYPNVRRCRQGENNSSNIVDGIRLDTNVYAQNAILYATGISRESIKNYDACHIWQDSCFDVRYHTVIANLVLLPRALAGLSDHNPEIQSILQYHAFELYDWYPQDQKKPAKPDNYPQEWPSPMPFTEKINRSLLRRRA